MNRTAGIIRRANRLLLLGVLFATSFVVPRQLEAQGMSPYAMSPVQGQPFATGVIPGQGYRGPNGMVTTQVPVDNEEYEPLPIETFIRTAVKNAWFRTEYMNWSIERPGNALLGTRTVNQPNTRSTFPVTGGVARTMDLEQINLNNNNGIRMTLGIPLRVGTLETSFFLQEQTTDNIFTPELEFRIPGRFITTTTFLNGQLTNSVPALYDESFQATYSSETWSGEFNIVLDPLNAPPTGEGLKIKPLFGVRFVNVHEELAQIGVFNNLRTQPDEVTAINSDVVNNLYGINIGLQTELVHKWFTVGFTPKVSLGFNTYRAEVQSVGVVGPADPLFLSRTDETDFAAVMEFSLYGKVHVSENFSLFTSYGMIWISRLARPHETIDYNINGVLGVPVSSAFKAKEEETNIWMQGFTVGGELNY
jgi:hypothetical protein